MGKMPKTLISLAAKKKTANMKEMNG